MEAAEAAALIRPVTQERLRMQMRLSVRVWCKWAIDRNKLCRDRMMRGRVHRRGGISNSSYQAESRQASQCAPASNDDANDVESSVPWFSMYPSVCLCVCAYLCLFPVNQYLSLCLFACLYVPASLCKTVLNSSHCCFCCWVYLCLCCPCLSACMAYNY